MSDKNKNDNKARIAFTVIAGVAAGAGTALAYFVGKNDGREEANRYHEYQEQLQAVRIAEEEDLKKEMAKNENVEEELIQSGECVVCIRPYSVIKDRDVKIFANACGHIFCEECINTWAARRQACPAGCNRRIENLRQLFMSFGPVE